MKTLFKQIMIIDDNAVDLYIGSRMIINNLFAEKVNEYSSASEALYFLQNNQDDLEKLPEVIFVDIYMPEMSGFDFMEQYARLPSALKNHCRVYILSSSIDDMDIVRAQVDPNTGIFLVKPITKESLDRIADGTY